MAYWNLGVVCLVVLVSGAQACCEPEKYSLSYEGKALLTQRAGLVRPNYEMAYNGTGFVDWSGGNIYQVISGDVMTGADNGVLHSFKIQFGIYKRTKLWMKLLKYNQCVVYNIKGGIPENYACLTDFYQRLSDNAYESPSECLSPRIKEHITVSDDCTVSSLHIAFDGPDPYGPDIRLLGKVTEIKLSVDSVEDSQVPEGCRLQEGDMELPPIGDYSDGLTWGIIKAGRSSRPFQERNMYKRDLLNESLERLARHLGDAVKWAV